MTGNQAREVELQIMCGLPRQPDHGEQLLIWVAMDLTGAVEGIYLKGGTDEAWRLRWVKGEDGFMRPANYAAKVDPSCPHCPTHLRVSVEKLAAHLEALRRHSGGEPSLLKVEYRDLPSLC